MTTSAIGHAREMESPIAEAQAFVSALRLVATHPDIEEHHQSAINVLANAIGDNLAQLEEQRQAIASGAE